MKEIYKHTSTLIERKGNSSKTKKEGAYFQVKINSFFINNLELVSPPRKLLCINNLRKEITTVLYCLSIY